MRLLILFVGCAFLAGGSKAQYPPSLATPRELGELVFSAIVNDDRAAYVALVMTDADCDSACARAHASDSAKAEVVEQMRGLARHVRGEANAVFDTLRMKGMQYGVEWATAQLIEVRYEIKDRNGVEQADVLLVCERNTRPFAVFLNNCLRGMAWRILDTAQLKTQ